jgi:hypothetical protein
MYSQFPCFFCWNLTCVKKNNIEFLLQFHISLSLACSAQAGLRACKTANFERPSAFSESDYGMAKRAVGAPPSTPQREGAAGPARMSPGAQCGSLSPSAGPARMSPGAQCGSLSTSSTTPDTLLDFGCEVCVRACVRECVRRRVVRGAFNAQGRFFLPMLIQSCPHRQRDPFPQHSCSGDSKANGAWQPGLFHPSSPQRVPRVSSALLFSASPCESAAFKH